MSKIFDWHNINFREETCILKDQGMEKARKNSQTVVEATEVETLHSDFLAVP